MADLHITEFSGLGGYSDAVFPAPMLPPIRTQKVDFVASATSLELDEGTTIVLLMVSEPAFLAFGDNPTATTAGMPLPADTPMFFSVRGRGMKIAALAA